MQSSWPVQCSVLIGWLVTEKEADWLIKSALKVAGCYLSRLVHVLCKEKDFCVCVCVWVSEYEEIAPLWNQPLVVVCGTAAWWVSNRADYTGPTVTLNQLISKDYQVLSLFLTAAQHKMHKGKTIFLVYGHFLFLFNFAVLYYSKCIVLYTIILLPDKNSFLHQ